MGRQLLRAFICLFLSAFLAACSSSDSGTIDKLVGHTNSSPILTSVPDQAIAQEDLLKLDFNNIKSGDPGSDEGMSYTCTFDNVVDGKVENGTPCANFPNATVSFNASSGILQLTPNTSSLGSYEVKITGSNSDGSATTIFRLGVRLKFTGIGQFTSITGNSVVATWTPNPSATSYQIFKLNSSTGQYELFRTITGGANSGTTITGLSPNTPYTLRVQAMDALGNLDGNVVSKSFTTTELVKFSMNPSTLSLAAGTPVTVTVQAYNANGTLQTIGGLALTPQIQSGTSSGNFSTVTDHNDGTYTFTFTPTVVGSSLELEITTNMTFFLQNTTHLDISPGPASSANSTIAINSSTVISGNSVTLTATVRDAYNNPITSGSTISFNKTGGTSTGNFSAVTNQGSGIYTATYTGITAGSAQTLTVSVGGAALTPSTTIQVLAGTPVSANSTVSVSASTIASGGVSNVTAVLKDINNNPVSSGILVAFNKSGGTSSGSFSAVVNAGGGTYTTTYTGIVAGTAQVITVSVDGVTLVPSASIQVVPGAAALANSSLTISNPTVVSGQFVTATATLKDANNNPIDSGVTVTFSKTGGTSTGTFGTVTNQGGGVYNIRYTGVTAGTAQTIQVLINGSALGASTTIAVVPGAPSVSNSSFSLASNVVVSGSSVTATATLRDLNNNPIPSGVLVAFNKSGGTSTGSLSAVTNAGNGVYTANYTGILAGSAQTISVLTDGSALGLTDSITVVSSSALLANSSLVIASPTVVSGSSVQVTATLKDLNNNPIDPASTVSFTKTGGTSTGTFSSVVSQGNGVYTVNYTGVVAGTAQTIKVLIDGTDLGPSVTITVNPGAPSSTHSSLSIAANTVVSGNAVTATATLKDNNDNPISSGVSVSFSKFGGTSTGTFSAVNNSGNGVYTIDYTGVVAGTAQTIALIADGSSLGPTVTVSVLPGGVLLANSSLTISSNTVTSGSFVTVTATLRDVNNNPIDPASTVTFSKTGGSATGNFGAISNSGNGIYSVNYTGIGAGTAQTLKVLINSVDLGPSVIVAVTPGAPSAAQSSISVSSGTVVSGGTVTVTATIKDANNNPISSGVLVAFSKAGGTSTGNFSSVSNMGAGIYTTTYEGVTAGTAQTLAFSVDGTTLGPTTTLTVLPGAPSSALSSLSLTSNSVIAGQTVTLTATIRDANNNPISSGLLVQFDKTGGTSFGNLSVVTNQGNGVYTAIYTGVTAGTAQTIQANVNGSSFGPTQTLQVLVGAPNLAHSSLNIMTSPVASGSSATIAAVIKDSQNNPITSEYAITFDTIGGSSTGNLSAVNQIGGGTFSITYAAVLAGSAQTARVLADNVPISGLSGTLQVIPGPVSSSNSLFTIGNSTVQSGTTVPLSVNLRDANSNTISNATVTFNKSVGTSDGTLGVVNNSGNGNYSSTYTGTVQGAAQTITLVVNGSSIPAMTVSATVTAGPPSNFTIVGPTNPLASIDCNGPYTVTLKDNSGNTTSSLTSFSMSFSSNPANSHVGTIFSDSSCNSAITSLPFGISVSNMTFYYKSYVPNNFTFMLTPSLGSIAANTTTIQNVAVLAWIGSAENLTFNGSGSATVMDDRGGGLWTPYGIVIRGTKMFVADQGSGRILKYDTSTNAFEGWIGHIGSLEGISAPCDSSVIGDLTPGWCTGSRSSPGTSTILYQPRGLGADATYIYVPSNHRILRFRQDTGAYAGWIGKANGTAPTADTTPPYYCGSPAANTKTPGWCYGGGVTSGSGDGEMNGPTDVLEVSGTLYVTDASNQRVQRFDATTGAFMGWTGRIGTLPSSPAACVSAGTGATAPTWCYGGTAQTASRYQLAGSPSEVAAPPEGFNNPLKLDGDSNYLYIADGNNRRVVRVATTDGTIAGWIGWIYRSSVLSPTAPAQTSGNYTSTWTQGGVTNDGYSPKGFCQTTGVKLDGTDLYVADSCHKVNRVQASDGQNYVWLGRVSGSPTGGYTGCSSTPVSGTTPGWCLGGAGNKFGNTNSAFYNPQGLETDSNYVYVVDRDNFRIEKFNKGNGDFAGWIGGATATAAKWTRTPAAQVARAGIDDYSFGEMSANYTAIALTGTKLFIPDVGWNRIKQYNLKDGSIVGYIGQISAFPPTGPDECVGYTSGMTPFWCTGGGRTTSSTAIQGYNNPYSLTADANYIYIANVSNQRIDRVRISDSLYLGWIGKISTVPTDGDPSCLSASIGDPTPTWCIGGTATSGTLAGQFNAPRAITYDPLNSKLYVGDTARLLRVDAATGAFEAATGSAGSGGCNVVNGVSDGWCSVSMGKAAVNNYGGFNVPTSIATDASYVYIADSGSHKVHRFDKTSGTPAGFIGRLNNATNLNTTATGGGCVGFTTGFPRVTNGWCFGGTFGVAISVPTVSSQDGALNSPRGITVDSNYIYVSDTNNHRISRYNLDGTFAGWKGYIASTGGPSGNMTGACLAAGAGAVTPTWCFGGTPGPGTLLGAFDTPTGIANDSNYLYVHDGKNNRIVTIPKS